VSHYINDDNLPLWHLVKATNTRLRDLVPLLKALDLPIETDEDGQFYTSRAAFGRVIRLAAGADQ